MKFKRHKVTKDDWLVVLVGILLGVILIWFSSVFGLDLIKRVWSSFLIIYCFSYFIGVVVNRIFKLHKWKTYFLCSYLWNYSCDWCYYRFDLWYI